MSDYPVFTIDCKGCGRRGRTSLITELFTVEYCPDCRKRLEAERPATSTEAVDGEAGQ